MRRYSDAYGRTASDAPIAAVTSGTASTPATVSATPSATASQMPSIPCSTAARSLPAPTWRATVPVVV